MPTIAPGSTPSPFQPQLTSHLQRLLPSARIEAMALPNTPSLQLYLLNEDYPQGDLSQQEMLALMDNPLYWVFCWASGQVLAEYLLKKPELVAGRRVLDFGCGSGVVAVAAAMAGACEVIACDIDPLALEATQYNAELNEVELTITDDYFAVDGDIDLIIVADVLYDKSNFPWLQRFIERAGRVLIADSRVKNFDFPGYRQIAARQGCTLPDLDESAEFRDVRLYYADQH